MWIFVIALLLLPFSTVHAAMCDVRSAAPTFTDLTAMGLMSCDTAGNQRVTLGTLISGEDQTNGVMKVEQQFLYKKIAHADTQVKASPGFIHTLSCVSDAAATAGSIVLYDSLTEGSTEILNMAIGAALYQFSLVLDVTFATGLYVGFTTTADVDCVVSYR